MEELLIIVLQIVFELVVQLIIYGGFDWIVWLFVHDDNPTAAGCFLMVVFFILGAAFGGLANWLHPHVFLPDQWLRIANLIAAPLAAGGVAWAFADWRRRRGVKLAPSVHFVHAFWFVLGFDLVRFIYATH